MSTFAAKSGRGLLLAAINLAAKNGVSFAAEEVEFQAPVVVDGQAYTTSVVYSVPARFSGTAEAHFSRLDLEGIFASANITEVKVREDAVTGTSTADIVTALNTRYGLEFDETDIIVEDFAAGSDSVVLRAADGSFGYTGELVVAITAHVDALADQVNPELGNLEAPTPVDSEAEPAPVN